MINWKPIESIPRDGTWVLIIVGGEYRPGEPFVPLAVRKIQSGESSNAVPWETGHDTCVYESELGSTFTHWAELNYPGQEVGHGQDEGSGD